MSATLISCVDSSCRDSACSSCSRLLSAGRSEKAEAVDKNDGGQIALWKRGVLSTCESQLSCGCASKHTAICDSRPAYRADRENVVFSPVKDGKRVLDEPAETVSHALSVGCGAVASSSADTTVNKRKKDMTEVAPSERQCAEPKSSVLDSCSAVGVWPGHCSVRLSRVNSGACGNSDTAGNAMTRVTVSRAPETSTINQSMGCENARLSTQLPPCDSSNVSADCGHEHSETLPCADMSNKDNLCGDISDDNDDDDGSDGGATFADGDDSSSDYEDTGSAVSGVTTASAGSLTPSLVGETFSSISLTDTATTVTHTVSASSAHRTVDSHRSGSAAIVCPAPLLASHFAHVPPVINFSTMHSQSDELPAIVRKLLRWRLSTITPRLVRQTLVNSNFRLLKQTPNWVGTWDKNMKSECFKTVRDFQKINHFPGSFQIGRKDKLWRNIAALQLKFGKSEFGFVPRTYILPADMKALRAAWRRDGAARKWIIKPPASARGAGIQVVHRWIEVPKKRPLVVQRYISRPLLVDDRKFDLRLYVYVTSFRPLRVYIYEDGLVRFASVKYSSDAGSLSDRFMHLTNYSINRHSQHYQPNTEAQQCCGHKWTLQAFWGHLRSTGVDVDALWRRIVDMVLKTLVAAEKHVAPLMAAHVISHYSCHEVFGFDVLIDHQMRPWLLEVNISPSLHSTAPVDVEVKAPLMRDLLNLAGFHIPSRLSATQLAQIGENVGVVRPDDVTVCDSESTTTNGGIDQSAAAKCNGIQSESSNEQTRQCRQSSLVGRLVLDKRLYTRVLSAEERSKHNHYANSPRELYLDSILDNLTPDDVRQLLRAEDELSRRGRFSRVFPTASTHVYHQYMDRTDYYCRLFDAWETKYGAGDSVSRATGIQLLRQLCNKKMHLSVPKNYLRRKEFTPMVIARAEKLRVDNLKESCGDSATQSVVNQVVSPSNEATSGGKSENQNCVSVLLERCDGDIVPPSAGSEQQESSDESVLNCPAAIDIGTGAASLVMPCSH